MKNQSKIKSLKNRNLQKIKKGKTKLKQEDSFPQVVFQNKVPKNK